jgi:signal transduction histidine kinase
VIVADTVLPRPPVVGGTARQIESDEMGQFEEQDAYSWGGIRTNTASRAANPSVFTNPAATTISGAESATRFTRLAEEQAALRRVATLVGRGVSAGELFKAVVDEVGRLLSAEYVHLIRYESDAMATSLVAFGRSDGILPAGASLKLGDENVVTRVFKTGRPARIDHKADSSGPFAVGAVENGVRSSVGTPIVVEGSLWGVIVVGCAETERLPGDTEARLASLTELVATAVANTEGRAELSRLTEDQAALRRIATLVARGIPPENVFAVVAAEVGRLLPAEYAHLGRYDPDGTVVIVGTWDDGYSTHLPVGTRQGVGGTNLATKVFETRRSARMDDYADASGPAGAAARERRVRSAVGTPIIVEGRVWGITLAGWRGTQPLPQDAETRLGDFTELVAVAIANAENSVELTASRARIVAAADESRRGIERDLHDGAQQRLVQAVIALKLLQKALSDRSADADELLREALRHAEQAQFELRELAHGILPAALTRGGLKAGIESLVARVSLTVSMDVSVTPLPAGIEATAYFVISEALTNVVKHARASGAEITARVADGELRVEVRDDGVGGAQSRDGRGLEGLRDRVAALAGRLELVSPTGGGTRVRAFLPITDPSETPGALSR